MWGPFLGPQIGRWLGTHSTPGTIVRQTPKRRREYDFEYKYYPRVISNVKSLLVQQEEVYLRRETSLVRTFQKYEFFDFLVFFRYCEVTHRSFGSAVKTTVTADLPPLPAPRGGTAHWRMQAGWRRVWAQTRRRVRSSKYRPSRALAVTRACRLRAASQRRLAIGCAPSKVASKCSTLLLNSGSRQSCTQDFPLPRAVRIGRREICLHSSLWQEARIGV